MATYYVSPNGSDENNGTSLDQPLATISAAHDVVEAGDTIYLRGGTYDLPLNTRTILSKSGTKDDPIRLVAYEDEQPILDASAWARDAGEFGRANNVVLIQTGDFWHLEGLEITGGPYLGFLAESVNGSVYKNLNVHSHDNTGFSLNGNSSDNLILGGDFHNNFDARRGGQDADGIAIKFGAGEGNVIDGARLFNNSDDGLDLWEFDGSITIKNTQAFGNGIDRWDHGPSFEGNGNGFKLSGGSAQALTTNQHILHNNVAWGNTFRGFDYNGSNGKFQVFDNTAYDNGYAGFNFQGGSHVLRNNLSFDNQVDHLIAGNVNDARNSWNLGVEINASDFASLDERQAEGPRQADGALADTNFLKLVSGSDLIDAGVDVGEDFAGSAPDLGAFETGSVPVEPAPTPTREPQPAPEVTPELGIEVIGDAGNNELTATNADDKIVGMAGDDRLLGGGGADALHGGAGEDEVWGGADADRLLGGRDADMLVGGGGNDKVYGHSGDDVLDGTWGEDILYGGRGADLLNGGSENDVLKAGLGRDEAYGGEGDDRLHGQVGKDFLSGDAGQDEIFGGIGADTLDGGADYDILTGGRGRDKFVFDAGDGGAWISDFAQGTDKIQINTGRFADLQITQKDSYAVVTYNGGYIEIAHTQAAEMEASDFLF